MGWGGAGRRARRRRRRGGGGGKEDGIILVIRLDTTLVHAILRSITGRKYCSCSHFGKEKLNYPSAIEQKSKECMHRGRDWKTTHDDGLSRRWPSANFHPR